MPTPHLRVTARCLQDDLDLTEQDAERFASLDARSFETAHKAVENFVAMRGTEPAMGKAIHGVRPRGLVRSLRVGQGRAVTTWDEEEDVCWLLAYNGFHQSGHPDDAYNVFVELHDNDDDLLPTAEDYELFFNTTDDDEEDYDGVVRLSLLDQLSVVSAELLQEARAHPLKEAVRTFNVNGKQIMCVDVLVEDDSYAEVGWMSLRLPEDEHLTDAVVYELLSALLPEDVHPLYETKFRDRDRMSGEIVYRWEYVTE